MKKLIAALLTTAMLVTVCSCWRKKPKTTETETSEPTTLTDSTGSEYTPTEWTEPSYSLEYPLGETVGTNYTGTFPTETTVPTGQQGMPHKYFSVDDVMKIIDDLSNIHTKDSGADYWNKVDGYTKNSPEENPVYGVTVETPGEWCPWSATAGGNGGYFTITPGSTVMFQMFIYDPEVADGVYNKCVERIKNVCDGTVEDIYYPSEGGYLNITSDPSTSEWGDHCYVHVDKDYSGRFDKNGFYLNICMPITTK